MNGRVRPLAVLVLCLLVLSGCRPAVVSAPAPPAIPPVVLEPAPTAPPAATNGRIAREHLVNLSSGIGARLAGSLEEAEAAAYIEAAFEDYGYDVQVQPFWFLDEDDEEIESANVIAVKPGSSALEIVVGAHYDSGDEAEGADDNASGVAVMLEVADMLQSVQTPYTVRFIAFGAEEVDMEGSRYYVGQMSPAEIQNTVAMINLDSLIAGDIAYVYGDAGAGTLRDWILEMAPEAGFDLEGRTAQELDEDDGTPCDCADYGPFQEVGIPFAYFEATNWNMCARDGMTQVDPSFGEAGVIRHTEYDTVQRIEQLFPGRIDQHLNLFVTLLYNTLTQFVAL